MDNCTKKDSGKRNFWASIMRRSDSSAIVAVLALFFVFSVFADNFLTSNNIFNVSRNASLYIFVAIGQAMVLITGGMNLSLGAVGGLSVVAAGFSMQVLHLPGPIATIIALLVGVLCGIFNGMIIIKFNINPFVVTLATSFIFAGLVNVISKGYPYTDIPTSYTTIGRGKFLGMPLLFWLMLAVLVCIHILFKYTLLGRRLLATGGNAQAAQLSGIQTKKIIVLGNTLSGFFAALAGVLWISRMGSAPPAMGSDWMLISFAVAVIGGTALAGGTISAIGILCSGFMLAFIKNGLVMLNVNVYLEQTFLGIIILLSVAIESARFRYSRVKKI